MTTDQMDGAASKTCFYWASIAGSDPEPVEVTSLDGRKVAYTCGCGDPFFLDEADCPVRLGESVYIPGDSSQHRLDFKKPAPMDRPSLADKKEAAEIDLHYHPRQSRRQHMWRGPR